MSRLFVLFLTAFLTMSSCNKEAPQNLKLMDGTYRGYFGRSSPTARFRTSEVTLHLKDYKFSGTTTIPQYPAICNGDYTITGQAIDFMNACVWSANFDWTYILDGRFNATISGDSLIMRRDYAHNVTDTYQLVRVDTANVR